MRLTLLALAARLHALGSRSYPGRHISSIDDMRRLFACNDAGIGGTAPEGKAQCHQLDKPHTRAEVVLCAMKRGTKSSSTYWVLPTQIFRRS